MIDSPASGPGETSESAKSLRDLMKSLHARESDMARLLGRFVRAESPSDDKPALDRFAHMLAGEWRSRGARAKLIQQSHAGNLVRVEWPPSGAPRYSPILLLGHFDTVYECSARFRACPSASAADAPLAPARLT